MIRFLPEQSKLINLSTNARFPRGAV